MKKNGPRRFQRRLFWRSALLVGLLLSACHKFPFLPDDDDDPSPPPPRPHDTRTFFVPDGQPTFTAFAGAVAYYGVRDGIQGEAAYRIEVPDNWNGVLVMYAHGFRGNGAVVFASKLVLLSGCGISALL